jgi:hypothetical protein
MNEADTILWDGKSGTEYKYWIHGIDAAFDEVAGNYIFAKEVTPGSYRPIYIGQSKNLGTRLENHEKEACARRNGATHIHVHTTPSGEKARKAEEADLIRRWKPVCNEQLVD